MCSSLNPAASRTITRSTSLSHLNRRGRRPPDRRLDAVRLDNAQRFGARGADEMLLNTIAGKILGLPQDHRPDKGIPFNQIPA